MQKFTYFLLKEPENPKRFFACGAPECLQGRHFCPPKKIKPRRELQIFLYAKIYIIFLYTNLKTPKTFLPAAGELVEGVFSQEQATSGVHLFQSIFRLFSFLNLLANVTLLCFFFFKKLNQAPKFAILQQKKKVFHVPLDQKVKSAISGFKFRKQAVLLQTSL